MRISDWSSDVCSSDLLARMKSEPDTTLQELADVRREDRAKPDPWDETSVKTSLTRLRGRAPVGERLYGTAPFGKWRTQTRDQVRGRLFIAGLTSDELIAPWVIEGAMIAQGDVVSGQFVMPLNTRNYDIYV